MPTAVTASLSDVPKPAMLQLTGISTALHTQLQAEVCSHSHRYKGAALRRATRMFTPSRGTTIQPYLS